MPRGKLAFRKADLSRVIDCYLRAGLSPQTALGKDGLVVYHGDEPPKGTKPFRGMLADDDAVNASWADLDDPDAA